MFSALRGLYNSLWIQRLLVLIAVVAMLWMLVPHLGTWGWWVVIVAIMVLLLEYLAFYRGVEYGIKTFNSMSKRDQMRLLKLLGDDDDEQNGAKM